MLGTNRFYEGQFKNTKRHGKGIATHPDGMTQEGFFKDDKLHGFVKETNGKGLHVQESEYFEGKLMVYLNAFAKISYGEKKKLLWE